VLWLLFSYQVFLDEVNTSSCMGLFKEIIIDKTFEGEVRMQFKIIIAPLMRIFIECEKYF